MSKKKVLTVMLTLLVAVCLLATSALAVAPTTPTAPTAPTAPTTPTDPTAPTNPTAPTHPTNPTDPTVGPNLPFTDITVGAWYYDAVVWAVENNVTVGTSATTFSPAKVCTRAELIEFVWNRAGQPKATIDSVPFTDVPESGSAAFWYEDSLLWAYENKIVAGTNEDGTTFSPNRACTRAEMMSFLVRLLSEDGDEVEVKTPFTDVDTGAWYYEDLLWAYTYELTYGTSATTFSPLNTCSRAEAVQFLYNAFAE